MQAGLNCAGLVGGTVVNNGDVFVLVVLFEYGDGVLPHVPEGSLKYPLVLFGVYARLLIAATLVAP